MESCLSDVEQERADRLRQAAGAQAVIRDVLALLRELDGLHDPNWRGPASAEYARALEWVGLDLRRALALAGEGRDLLQAAAR